MELLGRRNRTKFRESYVQPLLDAGWLAMTVPDKPTSRVQRYVMTDAGRRAVEALSGLDSARR